MLHTIEGTSSEVTHADKIYTDKQKKAELEADTRHQQNNTSWDRLLPLTKLVCQEDRVHVV